MFTCAFCKDHPCDTNDINNYPPNCPSRETEDLEKIKELYKEQENHHLAYQSALVEAEGYCQKTRLEETIDFAKKCNFQKLGIAFCIGFSNEAKTLSKILTHHGFSVHSVVCKNGSIPKEFLGIPEDKKVEPGTFEPMCNPIGQAMFLNKEGTEFNIVLGLCVGHDSLFIKLSDSPVTVFAVKDRVLAHNPLGAIYLSDGYYKKKVY